MLRLTVVLMHVATGLLMADPPILGQAPMLPQSTMQREDDTTNDLLVATMTSAPMLMSAPSSLSQATIETKSVSTVSATVDSGRPTEEKRLPQADQRLQRQQSKECEQHAPAATPPSAVEIEYAEVRRGGRFFPIFRGGRGGVRGGGC